MSKFDPAAVLAAVREYNAAYNSYRRALTELNAALPAGKLVLLHRAGDPRPLYWSYEKGDGSIITGVEAGRQGQEALIVEGPGPAEEYLPRLEAVGGEG
jgi:hypothetical protein